MQLEPHHPCSTSDARSVGALPAASYPYSRRIPCASAPSSHAVNAAAPRAFALSLEQGNAEAESLYLNHCSANNQYHAELVAELTAKLQGHSQAEIEAALIAFRCPLCGCPIA